MPQDINFPASLDDDDSLYLVVNNLRTRLTSDINNLVTTIPVISTAGFPTIGFVTILTGADITNAEAIAYNGTDGTNFLNAERGADGTTALSHKLNDAVDFTIVSRHHNNLKDSVIAIEHFLGVSGSENFVPFAAGNDVVLPGDLSVQNTLTVTGATTLEDTLTVFDSVILQDTLTVSDEATFAFITVTGSATMGGPVSITAGDLDVTGVITQSGVPVSTGTLIDINTTAVGPSVTIDDAGSVTVTTVGNTITVSGALAGAGTITDINTTAVGPSVTIVGGDNVNVSSVGNTITIDSTASGGGGDTTFVGAMLSSTSGVDFPQTTNTDMNWDTIQYDTTEGLVDLDADDHAFVMTAEHETSFWVLHGQLRWANSSDSGARVTLLSGPLNGAVRVSEENAGASIQMIQNVTSYPFQVPAGTRLRLRGSQISGGILEVEPISTWLSIERVGTSGTP